MAYQYVVQVTYNITTAADEISGKGSFQGPFRELCVKVKATDGGEQEFLKE